MIQHTAHHKSGNQPLNLMRVRPDPRTQSPFNPVAKGKDELYSLFGRDDQALYITKQTGRDQICVAAE